MRKGGELKRGLVRPGVRAGCERHPFGGVLERV